MGEVEVAQKKYTQDMNMGCEESESKKEKGHIIIERQCERTLGGPPKTQFNCPC